MDRLLLPDCESVQFVTTLNTASSRKKTAFRDLSMHKHRAGAQQKHGLEIKVCVQGSHSHGAGGPCQSVSTKHWLSLPCYSTLNTLHLSSTKFINFSRLVFFFLLKTQHISQGLHSVRTISFAASAPCQEGSSAALRCEQLPPGILQ